MKVALYVRVSTDEQTVEQQLRELRAFARERGDQVVEVFRDVISGTAQSRPGFNAMIHAASLKRFRAIYAWKIDRLGRSLLELLTVMQKLERYRCGVAFVTQRDIDTTSSHGRLIVSILAAFAQFERDLISERTRAGMETARRKGKRIGRPRKTPPLEKIEYLRQLNGGHIAKTARQLGVSRQTISRAIAARPKRGPGKQGSLPL